MALYDEVLLGRVTGLNELDKLFNPANYNVADDQQLRDGLAWIQSLERDGWRSPFGNRAPLDTGLRLRVLQLRRLIQHDLQMR